MTAAKRIPEHLLAHPYFEFVRQDVTILRQVEVYREPPPRLQP